MLRLMLVSAESLELLVSSSQTIREPQHTWQSLHSAVGGGEPDRGIMGALLSIDSRWSMLDEDD